MTPGRRLAVLGAGPVGLEAAARGLGEGWALTVLEAGEPAEHVRRWGHVRLFTAFRMNAGPAGLALLGRGRAGATTSLPDQGAILTGSAFREEYLLPLARAVADGGVLETAARVVSVARGHHLKHESVGGERRAADPFRLLIERRGTEEVRVADAVLDCTGTWARPNWLGPGGAPARGERALGDRIERGLPDVSGRDARRYAGRRTLLVGGGHSAATTALALAGLAERRPGTSFLWLTRRPAGELERIADDPLAERAGLVDRANALAQGTPPGSSWRGGARVLAVEPAGGRLRVAFEARPEGPGAPEEVEEVEEVEVDELVSAVGHEPDDGIYRQLQVHECYASRGPMKLAAALAASAGEGPVDCLDLGGFGEETLRNPEPGFFILGIKSYGRNGGFLLRTGYEQVEDVFSLLADRRPAAATA